MCDHFAADQAVIPPDIGDHHNWLPVVGARLRCHDAAVTNNEIRFVLQDLAFCSDQEGVQTCYEGPTEVRQRLWLLPTVLSANLELINAVAVSLLNQGVLR